MIYRHVPVNKRTAIIIISYFPHSPFMQPVEPCCAANFYATFQKYYFLGSVYCTVPISDIKSLVHRIAFFALIRFKYSTLLHQNRSPDGVVVNTLGCNAEGWDIVTHRTRFLKIALESYFASKSFFSLKSYY